MNRRLIAALVVGLLVIVGVGLKLWFVSQSAPTVSSLPTAVEPEPEPEIVEATSFTVIAGGDVMLGRSVDRRIQSYGGEHPFAKIADVMSAADFTLANLESPFRVDAAATLNGSLVLRGNPDGVKGLLKAGIDYVSLANNHIPDMGKVGLDDTFKILKENAILYSGAGETEEATHLPSIIDVKGKKIGLLSYTYGVNFDRPGVFYATTDAEVAAADIAALKNRSEPVDLIIVMAHFGSEYQPQASVAQKTFAHAVIDAGADVLIGHHPHVPQPVEQYGSGVIIYSLGNLVFDQEEVENRNFSALAKFSFSDKGGEEVMLDSLELLPYQIFDRNQPKLIENQSEKERIWKLFNLPSGKFEL